MKADKEEETIVYIYRSRSILKFNTFCAGGDNENN